MIESNKTYKSYPEEGNKDIAKLKAYTPPKYINFEDVKALISALGTMVQEPEFESDPTMIGKKNFKMYIQRPILEGENRTKVVNKLVELIEGM